MKINFDLLTHSPIYRVGEFDFDTTRYPRGKWGFSRISSGSGPHHGGVPTSGANSTQVVRKRLKTCHPIYIGVQKMITHVILMNFCTTNRNMIHDALISVIFGHKRNVGACY